MRMEIDQDEESLIQLMLELLSADHWKQDIYIRPLIYKARLGNRRAPARSKGRVEHLRDTV